MTPLTDTIFNAYAYDQSDIDKLAAKLTEQRRAAWLNSLADMARLHGCSQFPKPPKGADAKKLKTDSIKDAESIANTYNRELRNQIERIYKDNPRANRNTYARRLATWNARRDAYKVYQISLNTDSTARQYAQSRFYSMNPLEPRFVYSSIPPVSNECIRRTAAGVVTLAYVQSHPVPSHVNCPHQWRNVAPQRADCANLWLG